MRKAQRGPPLNPKTLTHGVGAASRVAFLRFCWQGWGNLNNGSNDGLVYSNGRNGLGNANVNIGSRNSLQKSSWAEAEIL